MNLGHHPPHRPLGLVSLTLALAMLPACGSTPQAPASAPSPAPSGAVVFAVPQAAGTTAQGGPLDAFAYAEKPGDAVLDQLVVAHGVARVTGSLWPQNGSTWAGIGFTAAGAGAGATLDLSAQRTLRLQLASATASQLRIRVMGADKATRDSGCYPVAVLAVSAQLREHEIPLASFAPEGYCGPNGRAIEATLPAVVAIEVSDATVTPGVRRAVDFQVGRIELRR